MVADPSLWKSIDLWRLIRRSSTHKGGYWTFPRKTSLVQSFLTRYTSGSLKELRIHVVVNGKIQNLLKDQCHNLQSLDIVINANDMDFSCLPIKLKHLTLAFTCNTKWQNLPSGDIPSNMHLQSLCLRYAKITYDFCSSLIHSDVIKKLRFDGCTWQVLPSEFRILSDRFSSLKAFYLISCHFPSPSCIYGIIHQMSSKCRQLNTFELNQPFIIGYQRDGLNHRLDGILESIGNWRTELDTLRISAAGGLSLNGLATITSVMHHNLKELSLTSCADVTNDFLKLISVNLSNLLFLNMSGCRRVTDVGLRYLCHHGSIRELHINGCSCLSEDCILATIKTMAELRVLTLPGWRGYNVCADLVQALRPRVKVQYW